MPQIKYYGVQICLSQQNFISQIYFFFFFKKYIFLLNWEIEKIMKFLIFYAFWTIGAEPIPRVNRDEASQFLTRTRRSYGTFGTGFYFLEI